MIEQIKTNNAPSAIGPYSQAIKCENLVFISGQLPIDTKKGEIPNNIKDQTTNVMKNIGAIIQQVSSDLTYDNLIKTTIYLKDMNQFNIVNEVYGSFFKDKFPARATIEVSRLPKDALVEIEAILAL